ncbi:aromatic-ring hydroxylase C-terminal domain-containing protein [Amycolatopsis sp. NPDC003865]
MPHGAGRPARPPGVHFGRRRPPGTALTGPTGTAGRDAAAKVGAELGLDLRAYGDWARLGGIDEDGCLLVRPDGYVARRHRTTSPAAAGSLVTALRTLLDRP